MKRLLFKNAYFKSVVGLLRLSAITGLDPNLFVAQNNLDESLSSLGFYRNNHNNMLRKIVIITPESPYIVSTKKNYVV